MVTATAMAMATARPSARATHKPSQVPRRKAGGPQLIKKGRRSFLASGLYGPFKMLYGEPGESLNLQKVQESPIRGGIIEENINDTHKWEAERMARNILVVEDDRNISDLIRMYLEKEGFEVRSAYDGGKAVEEFDKQAPDMVLLDIMLPVMDGWAVCAHIREKAKTPIIMLTAKSEVNDRITGLEMGADDYLVKPFEMKELMARINAVLRRSEIPDDTKKRLVFDKLVIDLDSYELLVDGKKIDTPPKELELLYHLASTPNRVYTRNQLLDEVWGFDYFGDSRTVDVHIKRLREKVENVSDQWALKTVWGVGYKFEVK